MFDNRVESKIGKSSELGVSALEDSQPIRLWPGASEVEVETVIRAAYRQVLGNAYVMDSERLKIAESHLKPGEISVCDFVREIALSDLYRSRFFDSCPRYRGIELNFKHFLGRAPESYQEMVDRSRLLDEKGYEAAICSYIDSEEYHEAFGENTVPFYRGYKTQPGKKVVAFTHSIQLWRGASSSDLANFPGNGSRLEQALITNKPSAVVLPSTISSYGGVTEMKKLLAEVLGPKLQEPEAAEKYTPSSEAYQTLLGQCEEMAEQIERMQERLADLRRVAAIGEVQSNKWSAYSRSFAGQENGATAQLPLPELLKTPLESESYESLQGRAELQSQAIAVLQKQQAQLQSLATIGEVRLNKWRRRIFSS